MIQSTLHALEVVIFVHQVDGVDLADAMRGDILRQPERFCRPLDIRPDSLTGPVPFRVVFMLEDVLCPGDFPHIL